MRILLIQSFTPAGEPAIYPLGLAYLAAVLPQHQVRIFDVNIIPDPFKALDEELSAFQPEIIGISLRNIKVVRPGIHFSCFQPHRELISFVKQRANNIPLIAGGTAFSLYAPRIMELLPEIDYGIFREGEVSFAELLARGMAAEDIQGVYYRKDGQVLSTAPGEWPDFASLPPPKRNLIGLANYLSEPTAIGVQTKRGCMMQCIHCSDPFLTGQILRLRPPEKVVDEIENLAMSYGVKEIMFVDQIFNIPLEHAQSICQGLIEKRIPIRWQAWFNPKYLSVEFLKLAQEAGCSRIIFSPDSVSNQVLERLKKGFTEEDLNRSYKLLARYNIPVGYDFMINGPGETLGSICKLFLFLFKAKIHLKGHLKLHGVFLVPMRIYPHSELQKRAIAEGIISAKDDLLEPVFYNPQPLRYISNFILAIISLLWRLKRFLKIGLRLKN
jgi:radical SAM superfamily enzyme YgiQ (UPF0313 family)